MIGEWVALGDGFAMLFGLVVLAVLLGIVGWVLNR